MQFRVFVPSGRLGRITSWTIPPSCRPSTLLEPAPDQVVVRMHPTRGKPSFGLRKATELITAHPTKFDINDPVWVLRPRDGVQHGTLLTFDTENILTAEDEQAYKTNRKDAVKKFKDVLCEVKTKSVVIVVRNQDLVRFRLL